MSNDFSLVGYESVSIAEYLPILENIKHDLTFIYERFTSNYKLLGTMNFPTLLNNTNVAVPSSNITDTIDGKSLHPESQKQILEQLNKIELLIPKTSEYHSDNNLSVIKKLEVYFKSLNQKSDQNTENASLNDELIEYKRQIKDKEAIINDQKDEIEKLKEKQMEKETKIENFKGQLKSLIDELAKKAEKIESINTNVKSLKDQLVVKDNEIDQLSQEIKTLQRNQSPKTKPDENKKSNPEFKKTLEEKIQRIIDLEAKIDKLEAKISEKNENLEKIQELENKNRQLEIKCENMYEEVQKEFQINLNNKKKELRDRDMKISELENELLDTESKLRKSDRENKNLRRKEVDITQEMSDLELQKEECEKKYKILRKENNKLKAQSQNDEDVTKYTEEIEKCKNIIKIKEKEMYEINISSKEMNQKISGLQEKLRTVQKELDDEKLNKTIEIEKLNTEIDSLKRDCEKKLQAIVKMREKIKIKTDENSTTLEIRKLQNQIKGKDMEIDQLHAKIENLNSAYELKYNDYETTVKEIEIRNSEIDNLKKLLKGQTRPDQNPKTPSDIPSWWSQHMNK